MERAADVAIRAMISFWFAIVWCDNCVLLDVDRAMMYCVGSCTVFTATARACDG